MPGGHFALLQHRDLVFRALGGNAPVSPAVSPATPN
jgi:hypothetical protein